MKVQLKQIISGPTGIWCQLPYYEKKGCFNYGRKDGCPPLAPRWNELIVAPYYLVFQKFDLKAQENRLLKKHPKWSIRRARCCLYWQRTVVKELLNEAEGVRIGLEYDLGDRFIIIENPEGAGIDLFKTCELVGLKLERDYLNQRYVYKMVIVGKVKK